MKARKILALILAVLMVLGTMPLALLAVSADGTGISAPTTLPDGETYIGTEFLLDSYDILAAYQAKKGVEGAEDVTNMGWIGANLLGAGASDAVHRGAEGIMFKIDATNATVDSNVLDIVIVIQLSYKNATTDAAASTYIVSNPTMAAAYSEAVCPDDAVSTWYYTLDGQDWTEMTAAKGTSRHSVPVGKGGEAYVYIPFDSFYTKCGESFLETGVADKTENVVPWAEAKPYFGTDFTFQMTNYYYTGDFKDNKTLAQDPAVKISEWRVVTHGTPGTNPGALPSELPTADGAFYNDEIMDGFTITGDTGNGYNGWWYASDTGCTNKIVVSDRTSWATAEGVMFKFDASKVAGTDPVQLTFEFSITSDIGSTYLIATPRLGQLYGGTIADGETVTSTWYICMDGVNWTSVQHTNATSEVGVLTSEHAVGYVFIPMDQFVTKAVALNEGGNAQDGKVLSGAQALEILGANNTEVKLGDMKVRLQKAAMDANFTITEIGFVHMGEDPNLGGSETPPEKLPNKDTVYSGVEFYKDSFDLMAYYQQKQDSSWMGGNYIGDKATALLKDGAEGIIFKVDTTDATALGDIFSMTFAFQIMFNANGKSCDTYIVSTPKHAAAFSEAVCPAGTESSWYYSKNGQTWTKLDASGSHTSVPVGKGITYVFIPMESFWFKCGETYLETGVHAHANGGEKENIVNWNDGKEFLGDDYYLNMSNYYFGGNFTSNVTVAQDPATKLSNWRIVKTGEGYGAITPPTGAESAPSTLPTTGGEYTFTEITPGYTFQHNTEKPWDGYWYMSSEPVTNKLNKNNIPADWMYSEGIMLKFDASNAPEGTDLLGMMVEIAIGSDKGSTYLLSDPNMVAGYGNTKSGAARKLPASVLKTATSTWYYSVDGLTWQAVVRGIETGNAPVVSLTNARTTGYVFIPMSSFWSYGINYGDFEDGQGMTAYETFDVLGKEIKVGDIKLRLANNDISNNSIITEFGFVKSTKLMFDQSVSVTDDMNWNIFTSLPAGYTNASLTFTMGSKTLTPKAVDMGNGILKYTFADISFADISTPITATFTAKDSSGVLKTETYTTTMEAYLRALYGDRSALVFKELAISMLHYGAAVQKVTGYTGTFANEGVPANEVPQSANRFANTTWINPAPSIWGGAEFVLNGGALTIKLAVNVPEGFTHIRYQTAGRLSTVEIKDGYAYLPVYAYEYRDTIGLNYYKRGLASSDNTAAVSFTHVLKNAVANANEDERAMFDAMVTFMNEARVYKR